MSATHPFGRLRLQLNSVWKLGRAEAGLPDIGRGIAGRRLTSELLTVGRYASGYCGGSASPRVREYTSHRHMYHQ